MPFRWTINPYRGCSHACMLLPAVGDTPVLMADGGTRADGRYGRRATTIYGTVRRGSLPPLRRSPRCSTTGQTIKPAYRVTLEDGTELVTSGDHRFLTERGWKHVVGAGRRSRAARPPHARTTSCVGPGGFASPPEHSADYQRGYLCGVIRGYGHLGRYRTRDHGRCLRSSPLPARARGRWRLSTLGAALPGDERLLGTERASYAAA